MSTSHTRTRLRGGDRYSWPLPVPESPVSLERRKQKGCSGFSFEFFSHGSDARYPVNQVTIGAVKILDE